MSKGIGSKSDNTSSIMEGIDEEENKSSPSTSPNKKTEKSESEPMCPLFMDGLPTDFTSNSALAALASLLEDDVPVDSTTKKATDKEESRRISGGGKVSGRRKASSRSKPYHNPKKKPSSSIGEAQLFLNMWKI